MTMTGDDTADAGTEAAPDLWHGLEVAHSRGATALDEDTPLVAVTWLSAHVAAVDRVLHPAAQVTLADGRRRVEELRRTDHVLLDALWRLDRHLTGDVHHRDADRRTLQDDVRAALVEHVRGEQALVQDLRAELGPVRARNLQGRLDAVLPHSPTRPHPDVWRIPALEGATFRAEALVDRARDLLDSRVVPTPRTPQTVRPLTRWGAWATAAPTQSDAPREVTAPHRDEGSPGDA